MPIVKIDWFEGKGEDQKRSVAKDFTDSLVRIIGCEPEAVTVIFNDHPRTNIAKAGKLRSDS